MVNCYICWKEFDPSFPRQFHSFPKDAERREKWFASIGYTISAYKNARICSDHFAQKDYYYCGTLVPCKRLYKTAIPSIFMQRSCQNKENSSNITNTQDNQDSVMDIEHDTTNGDNNITNEENTSNITNTQDSQDSIMRIEHDTSNGDNNTSNGAILSKRNSSGKRKRCNIDEVEKVFVKTGKHTVECLKKTEFTSNAWITFTKYLRYNRYLNKVSVARKSKLEKKLISLQSMTQMLKAKNLVTEDVANALKDVVPGPIEELLTRLLNEQKPKVFPHALRCFACTLHFHSPAAYSFLRKTFLKCLPHPTTVRTWMRNINSDSGISDQALKTVRNVVRNAREKNKKIVFNLTFDEMSIRKSVDWDGQKSHGFVDIGAVAKDKVPLASEVFVFMLVAINQNFKLPIAYYFTDKLNGREKAKLLKTILCALHENDLDIVSITFDGVSSNISMCEELGARLKQTEIEQIAPYFVHPADESKRIYIFYDACHMLKLVRNALGKEDLSDNENYIISWFIRQLVSLQNAEKLHLATKVRSRHVYFYNEKMKVHLAAQVFSNSVTAALGFGEYDLKLPHFAGASATATFCKTFNDVFDILNSKNLNNKTETKRAITKDKIRILKDNIERFVLYIKSLKNKDVPVLQSVRKTGFIGFVIDLQNSIALAEQLFNENTIEFLLTYKLSQDHIETFFSLIRRMNGWNNNPSAKQFKASYRKILHLANVSVPLSANCIPQDGTVLLNVFNNESVRNEQVTAHSVQQNADNDFEQDAANSIFMDHDYFNQNNNWFFTEYAEEVITYMSGFVAKTITHKIDCLFCKQLLIASEAQKESNTFTGKLLQRKNRGGLYVASPDVIIICKNAEKTFRSNQDKLFTTKNILNVLICQSFRSLPSYVFNTDRHIYEQFPLFDHQSQIIKLILKTFFNARLKHESTTLTNSIRRIRMKNNKLTLFQNQ